MVIPLLIALLTRSSFADPNVLRITLVGDVIPGSVAEKFKYLSPTAQQISDFQTITAGSDFVIGNYEGTLCNQGIAKKCEWQNPCYAFRLPESEAALFGKLGFRMLSVANNHSLDFEPVCRKTTVEVLETVGISTSGLPGQIARLKVKEVKVSLIAFHASAYFNSTLDLSKAARMIREERKRSDLLLVYFHGGAEGTGATRIPFKPEIYVGENRGDVVAFAHKAVQAGADFVFGSGPHVIRACEHYHGKVISYSLGDMIFGIDRTGESFEREGLAVRLDFDVGKRRLIHHFRSVLLGGNGWPALDPSGSAVSKLRQRSSEAFKSDNCAVEAK